MLPRHKLSAGKKADFNESPASLDSEVEWRTKSAFKPVTSVGAIPEYESGTGDLSIDDFDFLAEAEAEAVTERHEPIPEVTVPETQLPDVLGTSVMELIQPGTKKPRKSKEENYQEMLIVRNSLDFDERRFREDYARCESEIILRMRKDIDLLYDWLDKLVMDLTKTLNNLQEEKKRGVEERLRQIRENSVRADAINRSIQHFLSSVQHAYHHTFSAFLCNSAAVQVDDPSQSTRES